MAKQIDDTCEWHTPTDAPLRKVQTIIKKEAGMTFETDPNETFLIADTGEELRMACTMLGKARLDQEYVLDIGAHHGLFTVQAAKQGAYVFAVEPCPINVSILYANIEANGIEAQVMVIEKAVSTETGRIALLRRGGFPGQKSITFKESLAVDAEVETISLKDLLKQIQKAGVERIDFLKMDIEGEEFRIIEGPPVEELEMVEFMSVSLHSPDNVEYYECGDGRTREEYYDSMIDWLKGCGYTNARIHQHKALGIK